MKILITGSSGMVGRNLMFYLKTNTKFNLLNPSSSELNLLNYNSIINYLSENKPNIIIHCAGLVGGIQANIEKPYSFLSKNLIMGSNLIEAAVFNRITKCI